MKNVSLVLFIIISFSGFSQSIDLAEQLRSNKITVVNRQVSEYESDGIELSAREGDGLAILDLVEFDNGTIQLEIKGENTPGRSFVGLAFNIENDTTYEAVYFRPFNFVSEEAIRRSHMAQYIYHPVFTWYKLRQERTDEFEGELPAPPEPDGWFTAKISFTDDKVIVFVNEQSEPVFEIERLSVFNSSKIGLWVGNGSSGRFRNLVAFKAQ